MTPWREKCEASSRDEATSGREWEGVGGGGRGGGRGGGGVASTPSILCGQIGPACHGYPSGTLGHATAGTRVSGIFIPLGKIYNLGV